MKIILRKVLIISLITTILFTMFPVISFGALYNEEQAKDAYLAILKNCAEDLGKDGEINTKQKMQFDYLKKILDVWYDTDDNSSKLTVKENVIEDANGNTTTEYTLSDESGAENRTIRSIINGEIIPIIGNETIEYTLNGKEVTASAYTIIDGITAGGRNQIYGRNETKLENYMINKINPNAQVDVDYVPMKENNNLLFEAIGMVLTGIAKLIYYPLKFIVFLIPGGIIQLIIEGIANLDGTNGGAATMDRILFNEISLLDVNIFDTSGSGKNIGQIRQNIGMWYTSLRNLSFVISLCMLIYIGIRMALSNVSEKKAEYKEMLKNWFVGMLILSLMHFFMALLVNVNEALVKAIKGAMVFDDSYTNLVEQLLLNSLKINIIESTVSAICFLMLQGLTFGYIVMYVKRMLTVSLLTCIAPLITVTYSMDKVSDKKSQVLDTWIKEYSYNVLMQPFHCVIYIVFTKNAIDVLAENPESFAAAILAIMCMSFMVISEGIVKAIFGLKAQSMSSASSTIAAFAAGAATAANLTGQVDEATKKISNNIKTTEKMEKAMPKTKPKTQNASNKNSNKQEEKSKGFGKRVLTSAGKVAKKVYLNPKFTKYQMAMVTGALGLATGDAGTAINSANAGMAAGENLGAHMSELDRKNQVKTNERMFERQFDEFQAANPGVNMRESVAKILAGEKVPEGMEHFAAATIGLSNTYKLDGREDPIQDVLDNVDDLLKYQ